uniref:Elongator complex protein 4 n=1 Tax=Steinernema glaseri TaxID=37863 RepID=A0A1I7YK42_9BILA
MYLHRWHLILMPLRTRLVLFALFGTMIRNGAAPSVACIPGTTLKSRQLETSTGCSAIDHLLGGSLPNTGIVAIDEPASRAFTFALQRYFVGEGAAHNHHLVIASSSKKFPEELLSKIPMKRTGSSTDKRSEPMEMSDPSLKIAWRYATVPKVDSGIGKESQFDLGKILPAEDVERVPKTVMAGCSTYQECWKVLHEKFGEDEFTVEGKTKKNLLRIVIDGIGSPLWGDPQQFRSFLVHLRAFTRKSYAIVLISFDSSTLPESEATFLKHTVDAVFQLQSCDEGETIPGNVRANGRFYVEKLAAINSIATTALDCCDFVYELHRKSFDVKIMHLPPAFLDENPAVESAKPACSQFHDF